MLHFHSSFLEIKPLCGFCLSVRDQAQVLLNRVSSSYFKRPGFWQMAADEMLQGPDNSWDVTVPLTSIPE